MEIIWRFKVKPLLQAAYMGMTAGLLAVMLLDQWLWLEMRVNTSLLLPAATLAGLLIAAILKRSPRPAIALIAQSLCLLIFLVLFDFDFQALRVIPATWFREGFYLNGISIHGMNRIVAGIFIIGNGSFFCPEMDRGSLTRASSAASADHGPVARHL